jgi:hypothetical protein
VGRGLGRGGSSRRRTYCAGETLAAGVDGDVGGWAAGLCEAFEALNNDNVTLLNSALQQQKHKVSR